MRFNRSFLLFYAIASLLIGCKTNYVSQVKNSNNIVIDDKITADSNIVNFYTPFKQKLENEMNRPIGYSNHYLSKIGSQPEFLVGNFFTDGLLSAAKQVDPQVQIALATKGGIRSEIKQGTITVGSIFEVMPFENTITILELKGSDLLTLCNFIAKTGGQPIAGLTLQIKDKKPVNIKIDNQPIDINKSYKLATYDYLANGGDYIEGILNPINRINTTKTVRDELIKYVEQLTENGQNVNTQLDGRITILN